jgi:hypothetical protein
LYLYPFYNPTGGIRVLEEAWNVHSDDMKADFRIAESNLDALNTVDLKPKRLLCVGECALRARLTGPQFTAQVAAVVSLVEASANHRKATTVVKEVTASKYGDTTGHSTKQFLESPVAGKHPKAHFKGQQGGSGCRGGSDSRRSHSSGRLSGGPAPYGC